MAKWVYKFQEGNASMRNLLGGKGCNLAEMTGLGMPIPQGFTVTTEACTEYYNCGKKISVFGESTADEVAKEYGIPMLAKLPIDPKIADSVDQGVVEYVESPWLDEAADIIEKM